MICVVLLFSLVVAKGNSKREKENTRSPQVVSLRLNDLTTVVVDKAEYEGMEPVGIGVASGFSSPEHKAVFRVIASEEDDYAINYLEAAEKHSFSIELQNLFRRAIEEKRNIKCLL